MVTRTHKRSRSLTALITVPNPEHRAQSPFDSLSYSKTIRRRCYYTHTKKTTNDSAIQYNRIFDRTIRTATLLCVFFVVVTDRPSYCQVSHGKWVLFMAGVTEIHKIITGVSDSDLTMGLFNIKVGGDTGSQPYKIFKERPRLDVRKHLFFF